jgi:hypothetical protein
MTDLVPQAVRDLLAFYTERYPEVRFGDLDINVLKRAVESIDDAAKEVVAAEEALAQTRQQFRAIESELSQKAGRTLSFLRIFVEGDTEQLAVLDAIQMAMPATRRKAKAPVETTGEAKPRRTRKSKNADSSDSSSADAAIESALEKVGLSDDELSDFGVDTEASSTASASETSTVTKSGSRSAAE